MYPVEINPIEFITHHTANNMYIPFGMFTDNTEAKKSIVQIQKSTFQEWDTPTAEVLELNSQKAFDQVKRTMDDDVDHNFSELQQIYKIKISEQYTTMTYYTNISFITLYEKLSIGDGSTETREDGSTEPVDLVKTVAPLTTIISLPRRYYLDIIYFIHTWI